MITMTADDWMKLAPGGIGSITAAVGVILALKGFTKWRQEMFGKTEFDLARRTLMAVKKLTHTIASVRIVYSTATPETATKLISDEIAELDVCLLEASVLWGETLDEPSRELRRLARTLMLNMNRLARAAKDDRYREGLAKSGKLDEIDAIVWGEDDDAFGKQISAAAQRIDAMLSKHLPRRR